MRKELKDYLNQYVKVFAHVNEFSYAYIPEHNCRFPTILLKDIYLVTLRCMYNISYVDHIWVSLLKPMFGFLKLNVGDSISCLGRVNYYYKDTIDNVTFKDYTISNLSKIRIDTKGTGMSLLYAWAHLRRTGKVWECTNAFDKLLIPIYKDLSNSKVS
jgi:hypothetical protein